MDWRALPTAWIHFLLVESFHIYVCVATWHKLVVSVNARILETQLHVAVGGIEKYYSDLFFLGHALGSNITFNDGEELELPEAWAFHGVDWPWFLLAWILPLGALALYIHGIVGMVSLAKLGVYSFEEGAYISFTLQWVRTPLYQVCVCTMALSPVLLPVVWLVQVALYTEGDEASTNLAVFSGSTLTGLLLLLSLNRLAYPFRAYHGWLDSQCFKDLKLQRSLLQLFLGGSNASFVLKFIDALWSAQNSDMKRLERYAGPGVAADILRMCCDEQQRSAEQSPLRRDGASVAPADDAGAAV